MRTTIFNTPFLTPVLRRIATFLIWSIGWKSTGGPPPEKKYVITAGPHTSNWDYLLLVLVGLKFGVHVFWMGKHTIFNPPFRWLMLWMGGVPVDRRASQNLVDQMLEAFEQNEYMHLLIPPEGTRSKRARWKTGFWYIAKRANVPVYPSYVCFSLKESGVSTERIDLTDDLNADIRRIKAFYVDKVGRFPANGVHASDLNEVYEQEPIPKTGTSE